MSDYNQSTQFPDPEKLRHLFHKLWTSQVGKENYVKDEWMQLEHGILLAIAQIESNKVNDCGHLRKYEIIYMPGGIGCLECDLQKLKEETDRNLQQVHKLKQAIEKAEGIVKKLGNPIDEPSEPSEYKVEFRKVSVEYELLLALRNKSGYLLNKWSEKYGIKFGDSTNWDEVQQMAIDAYLEWLRK